MTRRSFSTSGAGCRCSGAGGSCRCSSSSGRDGSGAAEEHPHEGLSARQEWLRKRTAFDAEALRSMPQHQLDALASTVAGEEVDVPSASASSSGSGAGAGSDPVSAASSDRDDSAYTDGIGALRQMGAAEENGDGDADAESDSGDSLVFTPFSDEAERDGAGDGSGYTEGIGVLRRMG